MWRREEPQCVPRFSQNFLFCFLFFFYSNSTIRNLQYSTVQYPTLRLAKGESDYQLSFQFQNYLTELKLSDVSRWRHWHSTRGGTGRLQI
jgi:hypothetical protein